MVRTFPPIAETTTETLSPSSEATLVPGNPRPAVWTPSIVERDRVRPLFLLRVVRHHGRLILGLVFFLGLLSLTAAIWWLPPTLGTGTAVALIRMEPAETIPGTPPPRSEGWDLRTQGELLKTRYVIQSAIEQPSVQERIPEARNHSETLVKRLGDDLKVDSVSPQILRISLSGTNLAELPILVNAVKDAYLREIVEADTVRRQRRRETLLSAQSDCQKRLAQRQLELARLMADPTRNDRSSDRLAEQRVNRLQGELLRVELELERTRVLVSMPENDVPGPLADDPVDRDPQVQKYRQQITDVTKKMQDLERVLVHPTTLPKYQQLNQERDTIEANLKARRDSLEQQYVKAGSRRSREDANSRLTRLQREQQSLRSLLQQALEERRDLPAAPSDESTCRSEIDRLEKIGLSIETELESLRLQANSAPRAVSLQDAIEPQVRTNFRQSLRMILVSVGPVGLMLTLLFGREVVCRRIYSADEIHQQTDARLIGSTPWIEKRTTSTLDTRPTSESSSLDRLAASVRVEMAAMHAQTVLITSAIPGEGKSLLARELASGLARAGQRVLLIDGDLFRPTIAKAFDLKGSPGLSELLVGDAGLGDVIIPSPLANLSLLPAGHVTEMTFSRLAAGGAGPILDDLRHVFEVILIDCGPVLATSLPFAFGRHVDAAMLAVLAGTSRGPALRLALESLTSAAIPLMGLVLNGADPAHRYTTYYRHTEATA